MKDAPTRTRTSTSRTPGTRSGLRLRRTPSRDTRALPGRRTGLHTRQGRKRAREPSKAQGKFPRQALLPVRVREPRPRAQGHRKPRRKRPERHRGRFLPPRALRHRGRPRKRPSNPSPAASVDVSGLASGRGPASSAERGLESLRSGAASVNGLPPHERGERMSKRATDRRMVLPPLCFPSLRAGCRPFALRQLF